MYDVCVVGAGPAGSTLARLIGDRYRVLLVDRRRLDEPPADTGRVKSCGGLLAPKAQRELALQGLGLPGSVVVGPQLFAVRTLDLALGLERTYQRFYVNVDRELFDRWLVSRLPGAVDTAFGYRVSGLEVGPEDSLVRLRGERGGRGGVVARLVVGADGARSIVRRLALGDWPQPARYAAVQAAFASAAGDPFYGAIFDRSLTDFYGWTIPKGGATLVGLAVRPGAGTRAAFDAFVSRVREAGFCAGPELSRESTTVVRPRSTRELLCGVQGVALVGEAAGFVSPSSAEGISYALRSARLLASGLEAGIAGATERYRASTLPLRADIAARIAKSQAIYSTPTRQLLMRSGIGAIRRPVDSPRDVRRADALGF